MNFEWKTGRNKLGILFVFLDTIPLSIYLSTWKLQGAQSYNIYKYVCVMYAYVSHVCICVCTYPSYMHIYRSPFGFQFGSEV